MTFQKWKNPTKSASFDYKFNSTETFIDQCTFDNYFLGIVHFLLIYFEFSNSNTFLNIGSLFKRNSFPKTSSFVVVRKYKLAME